MQEPNIIQWLAEAKADPDAHLCGMYLTHNGVVRSVPKRTARQGVEGLSPVAYVDFSWDAAKLDAAVAEARTWPGVHYVRVWLAEGRVAVGESLMYVLIGADIRPNCVAALEKLVGYIKDQVVVEAEVPVDEAAAEDAAEATAAAPADAAASAPAGCPEA